MKCPCGGIILDVEDELTCGNCGRVSGYTPEQPPLMYTPGSTISSSTIGRQRVDYTGKSLSKSYHQKKMTRADSWSQKYNKSIPVARSLIYMMRDNMGLGDTCAEYALYLFKKAVQSGYLSGRSISATAAATVLLSCRKHSISRTILDIVNTTGLKRREVYRTYRYLYEQFDHSLPAPDPVIYIPRIVSKAGISGRTGREAVKLMQRIDRMEIAGKDPVVMAAAILYLACVRSGDMTLRRDIAKATCVSTSTLSKKYRHLSEIL